jgi:hypothetical protein
MAEMKTCRQCGRPVEVTPEGDEQANAEALANFGVADASRNEQMALVCDECYVEILAKWGHDD